MVSELSSFYKYVWVLRSGQLFGTPWTVAHQSLLSMEFSRQEHWSGLPFPSPGDPPYPGTEPVFPAFPALAGRFFYYCAPWEAHFTRVLYSKRKAILCQLIWPTPKGKCLLACSSGSDWPLGWYISDAAQCPAMPFDKEVACGSLWFLSKHSICL